MMQKNTSYDHSRIIALVTQSSCPKARLKALRDYYEHKIDCLKNTDLNPVLMRMACWDVPIQPEGLGNAWNRRRYIRQCRKFYQGQLSEIKRRIQSL